MSLSSTTETTDAPKTKYNRVMLKISGEALMGEQPFGHCLETDRCRLSGAEQARSFRVGGHEKRGEPDTVGEVDDFNVEIGGLSHRCGARAGAEQSRSEEIFHGICPLRIHL